VGGSRPGVGPNARRASTLMAGLAVHDKSADNRAFVKLLLVIERGALDERKLREKGGQPGRCAPHSASATWPSTRLPSRARRELRTGRETIALAGSVAVIPTDRSARWVANARAPRGSRPAKARARLKE